MTELDILIKGGTVVDGTGAPRRIADVAIADGRVVEIGDLGDRAAATVIDAEGLIVAPGFIDPHCHYDAQIFWDPYCTTSGWHGVTTVQLSNCGFGLAPMPKELHERALLMLTRTEQIALETMREGVPMDWETHPQFLDALRRTPKGVNAAAYFPLNPAMFAVMGPEESKTRQPTAEEVAQLKQMFAEALDAGAVGMSFTSTGGINNHTDYDGSQLPTEFLTEEVACAMAEEMRDRPGGLIQMLPRYADSARDFTFTEQVAAAAQKPVLYNAVVAAGAFVPGGLEGQLGWIEKCAADGLPVYGQGGINRFWLEYTLEEFNFFDHIPVWSRVSQIQDMGERLAAYADPAIRAEMKLPENFDDREWLLAGRGPQGAIVVDVKGHEDLKKYEGRVVGDIAEQEGRHPVDVYLDIACQTKLKAEFRTIYPASMNEQAAGQIARHPRTFLGLSDGGAHGHTFNGGGWPTEVLGWLVRDTQQLTLEQAHHKLSAFPAELAGFIDRGTLEPGKAADVVVYDLENLKAVPEFAYETAYDQPAGEWRRIQHVQGYRYTIVNGQITLIDSEPTGNLPGQVLAPGRP